MKTKTSLLLLGMLSISMIVFSQPISKCNFEIGVLGNDVGYLKEDPPVHIFVKMTDDVLNVTWIKPSGEKIENYEIIADEEGLYILSAVGKECILIDTFAVYCATGEKFINDILLIRKADNSKEQEINEYYKTPDGYSVYVNKNELHVKKMDEETPIVLTIFNEDGKIVLREINVKKSKLIKFATPLKNGTYTIFINSGFLKKIIV